MRVPYPKSCSVAKHRSIVQSEFDAVLVSKKLLEEELVSKDEHIKQLEAKITELEDMGDEVEQFSMLENKYFNVLEQLRDWLDRHCSCEQLRLQLTTLEDLERAAGLRYSKSDGT